MRPNKQKKNFNKGFTFFQKKNFNKGFTLMELIVVMAILAIVTVGLYGNFTSSQKKGRDAQRKSDLKQVQNALETYANDHNGLYPDDDSGTIAGLDWGAEFYDPDNADTIYMKVLPEDPRGIDYLYRVSSDNTQYQLYACLENDLDPEYNAYEGTNCNGCASGGVCTYGVSSTNATPAESF